MVRKIGNIFTVFVLCSVIHFLQADDAALMVNIADMQGNLVQEVEVGVPFIVHVTASNIDLADDAQPQGIEQWQNFAATPYGRSQNIQIVNGKTSKQLTFNYVVTPAHKGTFQTEPLKITDTDGKVFSSNSVKIMVADAVKIVQHRHNMQPYILQLDVPEKTVYVGQKITATFRFGYLQKCEQLRIEPVAMPNLHQGYIAQQATSGTLKIGDTQYQTKDFIFELYPLKVGNVLIPSFQASFVPDRRYQDVFSLMLGGGYQTAVHSQPRSLQVLPLPDASGYEQVSAVGTFDQAKFFMVQQQGKIGEGLMAKMQVVGDGNLEIAKAPVLNMPQGLNFYEGNSSVQRLDDGKFSKEFEWVIQADAAGTFEIFAQKFQYFNPATKSYHTLTTSPCSLVIIDEQADLQVQAPTTPDAQDLSIEQQSDQPKTVTTSSVPASVTNAHWLQKLQLFVPQLLMGRLIQLLLVVLVIMLLILIARRFAADLFFFKTLRVRYQFLTCVKRKDLQGLYRLFETLLQQYGLDMSGATLKESFMVLRLPEESFENWKNFVAMLWEFNFDKNRNFEQTDLALSLAKQWFPIILSCCKLNKKHNVGQKINS